MRAPVIAVAALLAVATPASAQDGPVRAGVGLRAIAPAGLQLLDVEVPRGGDAPVRLSFGPAQGRPHVLLDVRAAEDAAGARAAWQWARQTIVSTLPEVAGLGDAAFGDAGLAAFVRDNVFVVVRRVAGDRDARALAGRIDRAVQSAPVGSPRAAAFDPVPASAPQPDETTPVELGVEPLAARVWASGDAYVRRTGEGWVLTRTGPGDFTLHATIVDRRLRTRSR